MLKFKVLFICMIMVGTAHANDSNEFPEAKEEVDEPGIQFISHERLIVPSQGPKFRLELAMGYSSLVVDPDLNDGLGGGLFFAYWLHRRIGIEAAAFFSSNGYQALLGEIGTTFLAGNINVGPIFRVTPPDSRFTFTIDTGIGAYLIVPIFRESVWTFGLAAGVTLGYRIAPWFGVGVKFRYNLFNLATISGQEFKDLKAFMTVGVIDRLEIPGYIAFYF